MPGLLQTTRTKYIGAPGRTLALGQPIWALLRVGVQVPSGAVHRQCAVGALAGPVGVAVARLARVVLVMVEVACALAAPNAGRKLKAAFALIAFRLCSGCRCSESSGSGGLRPKNLFSFLKCCQS